MIELLSIGVKLINAVLIIKWYVVGALLATFRKGLPICITAWTISVKVFGGVFIIKRNVIDTLFADLDCNVSTRVAC